MCMRCKELYACAYGVKSCMHVCALVQDRLLSSSNTPCKSRVMKERERQASPCAAKDYSNVFFLLTPLGVELGSLA